MTLITSKRYPEADTYIGYIHRTAIETKVTRFPGLDSLASNIITNAVESEIYKEGGKILEVSVYSDNSWWGIIPTYTLTIEFKWYLPGESLGIGEKSLIAPAVIAAILWAIAAILGMIAIIYFIKKKYDVIEKYGYPPWYESLFGKIALLAIVGAGAYLVIKLVPPLYKKIYKEKKT